jgi:CO/xanthine dehydrogenase FAD-binding subunit
MIREYLRPTSVDEALLLLSEDGKERKPLGGGTSLSRQQAGNFGVVDLQDAGLDQIEMESQGITAGAMVRLERLMAYPDVHTEIKRAIQIDAGENIRNMATIGGWLVSGDGRSLFSTALLALDATSTWEPDQQKVRLGDWLPLRSHSHPGVLITDVAWSTSTRMIFEYVARSPKDRPILIVAVAQWGSGRTRVALGGFGDTPIIAMDGPDSSGVDLASRDAFYEAEDQWATAQYRREVAAKLALRCLQHLQAAKESEA